MDEDKFYMRLFQDSVNDDILELPVDRLGTFDTLSMHLDIFYIFDLQKNAILKASRGVSFENVVYCIENDKILDVVKHPNVEKYPDQWIVIVEIDHYAYQVPFKYEGTNIRLITVFPSRQCTQRYLKGD